MTVPRRYTNASLDFERLLTDMRDVSGLTSSHQTYTMLQGVLQTFRRRVSVEDAIRFANVLPPLVRALFAEDWDPGERRRPFEDRSIMTREVQALRAAHNFSPETCIRDVATALRKWVDAEDFDAVLAQLPDGATRFWSTEEPASGVDAEGRKS